MQPSIKITLHGGTNNTNYTPEYFLNTSSKHTILLHDFNVGFVIRKYRLGDYLILSVTYYL